MAFVRCSTLKTDMITLLGCFIFALHQMYSFAKIDPFANTQSQALFRCESLIHLYTFIVTIGIFLPI